jgi:hypothetical protein
VVEAFTLGTATNLVSGPMVAGARRLKETVVGDEQQRALEEAFRRATSAMIVELAASRHGDGSRDLLALLEAEGLVC